jgi:hypothetical protein
MEFDRDWLATRFRRSRQQSECRFRMHRTSGGVDVVRIRGIGRL